jgi:SAM-dependent methyltransferase
MEVDYRAASLASWESSAAGWAHWSRRLSESAREVTGWLVSKLELRPGDTVMELAAGAGETGFYAAMSAEVRVITTDFAEQMLEEARARAAELGVENAEFRVLDAERMDLADHSIDGVLCRYGYMLMADPALALRETRRVLRPGRRVALATWTHADRNPWTLIGRLLVERGALPPPGPGTPGICALPDAASVEPLLDAAGFTGVEAAEFEFVLDYPGFDGYWDFVSRAAGAVAGVIAAMPPDDVAELRRELVERVARFLEPDGSLAFPASSLAVAATA